MDPFIILPPSVGEFPGVSIHTGWRFNKSRCWENLEVRWVSHGKDLKPNAARKKPICKAKKKCYNTII